MSFKGLVTLLSLYITYSIASNIQENISPISVRMWIYGVFFPSGFIKSQYLSCGMVNL